MISHELKTCKVCIISLPKGIHTIYKISFLLIILLGRIGVPGKTAAGTSASKINTIFMLYWEK